MKILQTNRDDRNVLALHESLASSRSGNGSKVSQEGCLSSEDRILIKCERPSTTEDSRDSITNQHKSLETASRTRSRWGIDQESWLVSSRMRNSLCTRSLIDWCWYCSFVGVWRNLSCSVILENSESWPFDTIDWTRPVEMLTCAMILVNQWKYQPVYLSECGIWVCRTTIGNDELIIVARPTLRPAPVKRLRLMHRGCTISPFSIKSVASDCRTLRYRIASSNQIDETQRMGLWNVLSVPLDVSRHPFTSCAHLMPRPVVEPPLVRSQAHLRPCKKLSIASWQH